ncbi:MAG: hypothetical protein IT340_17945 [Chloroflexi bacterium]|nr:hypothetical protein [Chloroflexota bacterium]
MREPPSGLADATLRAGLSAAYGLAVADLAFLPLGHDALAWVYRVRTADDRAYFLQVRRGAINEAGLLAPRERALMLAAGGFSRAWVGPREEALAFQGYGATTIVALAFSADGGVMTSMG